MVFFILYSFKTKSNQPSFLVKDYKNEKKEKVVILSIEEVPVTSKCNKMELCWLLVGWPNNVSTYKTSIMKFTLVGFPILRVLVDNVVALNNLLYFIITKVL